MILAGALICGALLIAWLGPVPLEKLLRGKDPALALICWVTAIAAVIVSAGVGVILLLVAGDHPHAVSGWLHACGVFQHRHLHPADEFAGVALLAMLLVGAWRIGTIAVKRIRRQRHTHRAHLTLLRTTGGNGSVLWLEHDALFAYSIAGRPGLVVATQGLRRLPAGYLRAILHHERHHLRRHHHLLVLAVESLREATPHVPLFAAAPRAIRELAELTADATAARSCGPGTVSRALLAVNTPTSPAGNTTAGSLPLRLSHLSSAGTGYGPLVALRRTLAGVTSSMLPALLGAGTLIALVSVIC